jgi:NADH-quinone oxidoreductase subunit B
VTGNSFYVSTIGRVLNWARAQSLDYISTGSGCCADEVLNSMGCRYDLERFGCVPQIEPNQADLLIVNGFVSEKAEPHLRALYDAMKNPKYVLAVGACASSGGMFAPECSYAVKKTVSSIVPVDVFVPGCPPRPEAIMDGLIELQEKIRGNQRTRHTNA